jgi:hypothetical protein
VLATTVHLTGSIHETADSAEHFAERWDLADGLPSWERELVTANFEDVEEPVGAGAEVW